MLGFFQYQSDVIGLLLGIFFFHESFGLPRSARLPVWAAIAVYGGGEFQEMRPRMKWSELMPNAMLAGLKLRL